MSRRKKHLKKAVLAGYFIMTHILPVRRRIVMFQSSLGRNCTGNPRAVYEKMVELGLDRRFSCYYILDEPKRFLGQLPGKIRLVKNARLKYYFLMAMAGIWVSDTRFQNYIRKRKKTLYIQTWHGTPLKKLALDMESIHMAGGESLKEYREEFRQNTKTWDYLVSQNPFSTETFCRAFAYQGKMLPIGYPRNDRLFAAPHAKALAREKKKLALPANKKIMLYAPTWRDDSFYGEGAYRFETQLDFGKMKEAFGQEYILVVKFHYLVKEKADWNRYPGFVYAADAKTDIAELYLVADLLITDYSSAMFDYSILRRPMFFYAFDLERYRDSLRGFYFDFLAEAPGPVVTTTKELIEQIKALSGERYMEEYGERYQAFCKKYNPYDDGNASFKLIALMNQHAKIR